MKELQRNTNYMVDKQGNVYSKKRNKILSPKENHDGYLRIQLWKANKCEYVSIHRLIAETFIENVDNKPFVNHIDGNKQNNNVENLEWCTQKENIKHAFDTGLSTRCPKNWKINSISVEQYSKTDIYIKTFPSTMEVERQLGIPHSQISNVCKNKKNYVTAGGFKWKYSETSNDYLA